MSFKSKLLSYILDSEWNVGFVDVHPDEIVNVKSLQNINWLEHKYKDRWFADPFVLEVTDDRILLLVEECRYEDHKGRISLLTIDKNTFVLLEDRVLIEEPTHLSFPAYFCKDNEVYVYPESGESGALSMYHLDKNRQTAVNIKTLVDAPISDAIIIDFDGNNYIFAIQWPEPSTNLMEVYQEVDNGYKHIRTISFGSKIARNAGSWFYVDGKLIRSAQDCDRRYGHALVFQEVNLDTMEFVTINRIVPTSKKYELGMHTYNYLDGIAVVDGYCYRRPFFAHLYAAISNTYHKIRGIDYRI